MRVPLLLFRFSPLQSGVRRFKPVRNENSTLLAHFLGHGSLLYMGWCKDTTQSYQRMRENCCILAMGMNGAVIIGGHIQGLGIIRSFGRNGIPCYLLDRTSVNIARHSKYCRKFLTIEDGADIVDQLIDVNIRHQLKDWLLMPTDDRMVNVLSQHRERLSEYYRVAVDSWDTVEKCYNKRLTYELVSRIGVDHPGTFFPDSAEDLDGIEISFPCIIKPAVMHSLYSRTKKKVIVCHSREELRDRYAWVLSYIPPDEVIVQEIIPGDSENQYSACFFFDRDRPVVSMLARRKRQYPPDFGQGTSFAETVEDPVLMQSAIRILTEMRYWGLCEVEFKRDPRDGKYKFLEVNPRTWRWHSIANKAGCPFLMSLYSAIYSGRPIVKNDWSPACWHDRLLDTAVTLRSVAQGRLNLHPASHRGNTECAVFDPRDIKPALFELLYLPILMHSR
jgi:D-aspartate ligase